jgi:4'-phosphopantetheinyl transferase
VVGTRRRRATIEVLLAPQDPLDGGRAEVLSHEERSRATAIGDDAERDRFYGGRRLLRHALAERTGRPARDLEIVSGANGHTVLLGGGPHFSLAHSEHWYAVALSEDCPVGVAVAPTSDRPALSSVVPALLPPVALTEIAATPPPLRPELTLRWWLTLEAAVRACGATRDQAAQCLPRVSVEVAHPTPAAMAAVAGCTARAVQVRWRVLTVQEAGVPA